MSRSLLVLWIAILSAIALIVVLAAFWNAQREANEAQRVEEILQAQLVPVREVVNRVLEDYAVELERNLAEFAPRDLLACVELRRSPLVDEVVVIDSARQLHFPRDSRLSSERQALVAEALQLLREQPLSTPRSQSAQPVSQQPVSQQVNSQQAYTQQQITQPLANLAQASQWHSWYHRRGIVLGVSRMDAAGWSTMVILPTARWTADIVGALPESTTESIHGNSNKISLRTQDYISPGAPLSGRLNQLLDVEGKVIYQWGDTTSVDWNALVDQAAGPASSASISLATPLEGWRLRAWTTPELRQRLAGDGWWLPLVIAVVALSCALLLAGILVTLSLRRELRVAASRVSFVNQVSHELRTPLTNIRMYADLLAHELERQGATAELTARVAVIQNESQRLGRLIANVLQFARPDRHLAARLAPAVLDDLVREVLDTFRPRLQQAGFSVELQLHVPQQLMLPVDAIEQILVNLIGNAEKYAATGQFLLIRTQLTDGLIRIDVQDHGPGIPASQAEWVFAPFARLHDRLEAPTGTGIGLTIARRLAEDLGGRCELIPSPQGAHFRCSLPVLGKP